MVGHPWDPDEETWEEGYYSYSMDLLNSRMRRRALLLRPCPSGQPEARLENDPI